MLPSVPGTIEQPFFKLMRSIADKTGGIGVFTGYFEKYCCVLIFFLFVLGERHFFVHTNCNHLPFPKHFERSHTVTRTSACNPLTPTTTRGFWFRTQTTPSSRSKRGRTVATGYFRFHCRTAAASGAKRGRAAAGAAGGTERRTATGAVGTAFAEK